MKSNKLTAVVSAVLLCVIVLGTMGCQNDSTLTNVEPSTTVSSQNGKMPNVETGLIGGIIGLTDKLLGQIIRLVGLDGGILQVRTTSFEIPDSALTTRTVISYSMFNATPPPGLLSASNRLFTFLPEGLKFSRSCKLIVPFSELDLGNTNPETLICYYYNEQTRLYEAQPTTVDMQRRRFIVKINHFSRYAFGRLE